MVFTFEKLASYVAAQFKKDIEENGFDSFEDMKSCYWWDTNDIKDEVEYHIQEADKQSNQLICMSDDRSDVYINDDYISYRKFSAMWHKALD